MFPLSLRAAVSFYRRAEDKAAEYGGLYPGRGVREYTNATYTREIDPAY